MAEIDTTKLSSRSTSSTLILGGSYHPPPADASPRFHRRSPVSTPSFRPQPLPPLPLMLNSILPSCSAIFCPQLTVDSCALPLPRSFASCWCSGSLGEVGQRFRRLSGYREPQSSFRSPRVRGISLRLPTSARFQSPAQRRQLGCARSWCSDASMSRLSLKHREHGSTAQNTRIASNGRPEPCDRARTRSAAAATAAEGAPKVVMLIKSSVFQPDVSPDCLSGVGWG